MSSSTSQPQHKKIAHRMASTWRRIVTKTPGNPHHPFRLTPLRWRRFKPAELKSSWHLLSDTWRFIGAHKRIMLGLGLLYAVIGYFLVGGVSQFDYVTFKEASMQVVDGNIGALGTAASLFGAAVTGNLTSPPSELQQFLSGVLLLLFWLSLLWAARMLSADKDITLRDALYNSGGPIIPTLVVLAVIVAQLLPAAIGIFVYAAALNGGWLTGGVESMVFALAAVSLSLLSAYFVVSSLTALVVVALPGTHPWYALKTTRGLVMNRRWGLVMRILLLVCYVLILWAVVLIPVFLLDNWLRFDWLPLVPICMQALIGLTLVYTTTYVYKLYRSLL